MMVSVQRSIEIRVPVHTLYNQLTQFEDYPQFMHDIESVEQVDDTHLHWKAKTEDGAEEWDAVITEQVPDQCIAWHTESGPSNSGKVELQPVGPAASRLTLTMVTEREPMPTTPAGDIKAEMSEKIWEDLARLRKLIESRGQESGAWRGEVHGAQVTMQDRAAEKQPGLDENDSQMAGQESGPVADLGLAQGTGEAGNTAGRDGIDEVAKLGSEGTEHGNTVMQNSDSPAKEKSALQANTTVAELGVAQGTGESGNTAGRDGIDEVAKLGSMEGTEHGSQSGSNQISQKDADVSQLSGQESGPVAELGVAQGTGQAGNTAGRDGIDEVAKLGSMEGMEQGDNGQSGQQAQSAVETIQRDRGSPGNPVPASGMTQQAAFPKDTAQHNDPEDSAFRQVSMPHQSDPTQSGYSLSQSTGDSLQGSLFSIAEEVSFDQQSDEARQVGHMPEGDSDEENTGVPRYDAIGKAMQRGRPEPEV